MSRTTFIYTFSLPTQFFIPVYQRNYDWKVENCEQLIEDIDALSTKIQEQGEQSTASHFLSCVVVLKTPKKHIIIDGQQRLTTISLLLLALYNAIQEYKQNRVVRETYEEISQEIYRNLFAASGKPKLILKEEDQKVFASLLQQDLIDNSLKNSNIYLNYQYFFNCIKRNYIENIEPFYNAITKLTYIEYNLAHDENPQEVFESLNSTGVDLTDGDKIRNYILMNQTLENQDRFYKNYWFKIEKYASQELPNFFRHFLTIKLKKLVNQSKVYIEFKNYIKKNSITNMELFLQEITRYARYYAILRENPLLQSSVLDHLNISKRVQNCICRINYLKRSITYPFLMSVLDVYENQHLSVHDLEEIFEITETYIYREIICDLKTDNKLFAFIHYSIYRLDNNFDNYLEKYKYVLLSKTDALRWPEDKEFADKFIETPIGLTNREAIIYTLDRLEKYYKQEQAQNFILKDKKKDGTLTIEHIIPKTLNYKWQKTLGINSKEIQAFWYNKIANLTLITSTSRPSLSFNEKLDFLRENDQSCLDFFLNDYVKKQTTWTEEQLKERSAILQQNVTKIWKNISTTYVSNLKSEQYLTVDDEFDFTGYQLSKFVFDGKTYQKKNWNEFLKVILERLYDQEKYKYKLLQLINKGSFQVIQTTENNLSNCFQLRYDINIYIQNNIRTQQKIKILKQIFEELDIPSNILQLYVNDKDKVENKDLS